MKKSLITLILLTGLTTSNTYAAPVLTASERLLGFNEISTHHWYGTDLAPGSYVATSDGTTAESSLVGEKVINGTDFLGNSASMIIQYDGASEAHADGTLKARAYASLENGFYTAENDPFVIDTEFNTNPDGVPEDILFESRAQFSDSLAITGAANLDHITIEVSFDGTFEWDGSGEAVSSVQISQITKNGSISNYSNLFATASYSDTVVEDTVASATMQVTGGLADISFSMITSVDFSHSDEFGPPSENLFDDNFEIDLVYGEADFFNTMTLGTIRGFDANGNPVDVSGATGSSGYSFNTFRVNNATVPEPAPLALLGLGLLGLGLARKRAAK